MDAAHKCFSLCALSVNWDWHCKRGITDCHNALCWQLHANPYSERTWLAGFPRNLGNEIPWLFHDFPWPNQWFSVTISVAKILAIFHMKFISGQLRKTKSMTIFRMQIKVNLWLSMTTSVVGILAFFYEKFINALFWKTPHVYFLNVN